ncbi:MAG: prepilin peptidase [Cyanobacteria bacterium SZAS LIN-2]|nr:prepilin peptidase [Cyanobacteria bacterium SZAS LIN-3]MBS1996590.1 prepilin peptidase [Cyanobacteria bacterium SZAS LIN-2]
MGFITPGFDFFEIQSPYLEMWAALAGLIVGSFLNVLALRSLSGESLWTPFSNCPRCKHRLGILELVPIISYLALKGRCAHCKEKIGWHYPVVEASTAVLFAAVVHHFAQPVFADAPDHVLITMAMLYFTSIMVAVTVTDFKEKLIPHEITYPSIILGLIFSFSVRHDLLGALAGVGVSYILFDFIAFYGLKFYMWMHRDDLLEEEGAGKVEAEIFDDEIDANFDIVREPVAAKAAGPGAEEEEEPFEVMGGGDAVLSAVMAAWLGWEKLAISLVIGFMVGAIMGAFYLIYELKQQNRLGQVAKPAIIGFLLTSGPFSLIAVALGFYFHMPEIYTNINVWILDLIVGFGGTTAAVIWSGNSIAKPFPFGPALAFGAMYAVFMTNLTDGTFIKGLR